MPVALDVVVGSCPCTDCRLHEKCAARLAACARFSMFVAGETELRWRSAPAVPSRAIFEAVLGAVDPRERAREAEARRRRAREKRQRATRHPAHVVATTSA